MIATQSTITKNDTAVLVRISFRSSEIFILFFGYKFQ
jgi:hypothetical protein